jgi:hypothetical protein
MKYIYVFLTLLCFHVFTCKGQSLQDTTKVFKIETIDGNIYMGSIIAEDQMTLVLKTDRLGELRILRSDIKSITELKAFKKVEGKIWLPNPQSSRYFWGPNGYGLEKGSSYYQNIWVLYNQVSTGVTDNFSIGVGILPLFLFAGSPTPIWIVPKFSIPVSKEKVNIGTGAILGTVLSEDSGFFGLLYETTTFGSRDKNLSAGFGYGFSRNGWMQRPIINVSAMIRINPKGYFITENYAIPVDNVYLFVISLGGRSIIRNIGLDYSLWIPFGYDIGTFVAIPFLGVTVPLGKKKPGT